MLSNKKSWLALRSLSIKSLSSRVQLQPGPLPPLSPVQVVTREVRGGYYNPVLYLASKLTLDGGEGPCQQC